MSILIRGMKMPKSCQDCPCSGDKCFREFYGKDAPNLCNLLNVDVTHYTNSRYKDCPLIEVSTPHGRLIDADELEDLIADEFNGVCTYDVSPDEAVSDFQNIIDRCKTIIKAEE